MNGIKRTRVIAASMDFDQITYDEKIKHEYDR